MIKYSSSFSKCRNVVQQAEQQSFQNVHLLLLSSSLLRILLLLLSLILLLLILLIFLLLLFLLSLSLSLLLLLLYYYYYYYNFYYYYYYYYYYYNIIIIIIIIIVIIIIIIIIASIMYKDFVDVNLHIAHWIFLHEQHCSVLAILWNRGYTVEGDICLFGSKCSRKVMWEHLIVFFYSR